MHDSGAPTGATAPQVRAGASGRPPRGRRGCPSCDGDGGGPVASFGFCKLPDAGRCATPSCLAEGDCRLTTVPSGEDEISDKAKARLSPERVLFEFELYPAQDELALLPERLENVEVDLRFDDDPTRLTWPDVTMMPVHGDGSTSWTMEANDGALGQLRDEVELVGRRARDVAWRRGTASAQFLRGSDCQLDPSPVR